LIGVLAVTHGDLGQACIGAVELIAGEQTNVKALGLHHGDSPDTLKENIRAALKELDEGEGVLVFVDFFGGTPANLVLQCMREKPFLCIAGLNMPVLLQALTEREGNTIEELEKTCLQTGKDSFIEMHEVYRKMSEQH